MLFNLSEEICSILLLGTMFFAFLKQHVTNLSIYQASRFRADAGVWNKVICHSFFHRGKITLNTLTAFVKKAQNSAML